LSGMAGHGIAFAIVLMSLSFHEAAHGLVASLRGDPTAKEQGRLTLNPLRHIDPVGTIFLPMILMGMSGLSGGLVPVFGYARPVPVNPMRLSRPKIDLCLVALAGPAANLILAAVALCIFFAFPGARSLGEILLSVYAINLLLALFNLLPIPPLDGSRLLALFPSPKVFQRHGRALNIAGIVGILILAQTGLLSRVFLKTATSILGLAARAWSVH